MQATPQEECEEKQLRAIQTPQVAKGLGTLMEPMPHVEMMLDWRIESPISLLTR